MTALGAPAFSIALPSNPSHRKNGAPQALHHREGGSRPEEVRQGQGRGQGQEGRRRRRWVVHSFPGWCCGLCPGAGPAWLLAAGARPEGMLLPCEGSEGEGPGVHRRLEEEGRWGAQDACQAVARRVQPRPWWRRAAPCPPEKRKAKRKASAAKRAAKKKAAAAKKAEKAKAKKAKRAAKKAAKAAKKAAKKKAKKAKKPKKAAKK